MNESWRERDWSEGGVSIVALFLQSLPQEITFLCFLKTLMFFFFS